MIRLARERFCYRIENLAADGTREDDVLVQVDYDYPGTASDFGWSVASVGGSRYSWCGHDGTDGTIGCSACGLTATDFISSAADYLDSHDGATADDPGYFTGE